jgi:hypothetical protein
MTKQVDLWGGNDSGSYKGESVNRPQIDTKRKNVIFEPEKKSFISRHILHQHW